MKFISKIFKREKPDAIVESSGLIDNKLTHKESIGNRYVKTKRGEFIHYDLYQDNKFITSMLGYRN
ncbi:hypothetical protein CSC2_21640 [Clostridium zeae]|uniref:Uncharacterized protein n=1 Tax=Clostridium zeae TaxID=2759022 RepID=A0ABQ1EAU7_9CLOT|nr:hypothetical protein [Clostridium zeae]GFZ31638.1 hypothetical protein CSC2_21640 [Clostridium zeae]